MAKKEDLRVIKTRRSIRDAFLHLLEVKDFSAITVQDILDQALINRTTFYKHYDSKYHLADTLSAEIIGSYDSLLDFTLSSHRDAGHFFQTVEQMTDHFYSERRLVLALWHLSLNGQDLSGRLEQLLSTRFRAYLEASARKEDRLDYQSAIMSTLILTTLKYLLESEDRPNIQALREQTLHLMGRLRIEGEQHPAER